MNDYPAFGKIPRWDRDVWITEKIDGTNALVHVEPLDPGAPEVPGVNVVSYAEAEWTVRAGSRNRWLARDADNFGFSAWVDDYADDLVRLGPGTHYGEWYGRKIGRGYGLDHRRFALFNVARWADLAARPACCDVVPVLSVTTGASASPTILYALDFLRDKGSQVPGARGYDRPEGVVIYHAAANQYFKSLCHGDALPKGLAVAA